MKKFFILAIAAMALSFNSCTKKPVDQAKDLVEEMIDAAENKDIEKLVKVAKEVKELDDKLTDEDEKALDEWGESEEGKKTQERLEKAMTNMMKDLKPEDLEALKDIDL